MMMDLDLIRLRCRRHYQHPLGLVRLPRLALFSVAACADPPLPLTQEEADEMAAAFDSMVAGAPRDIPEAETVEVPKPAPPGTEPETEPEPPQIEMAVEPDPEPDPAADPSWRPADDMRILKAALAAEDPDVTGARIGRTGDEIIDRLDVIAPAWAVSEEAIRDAIAEAHARR